MGDQSFVILTKAAAAPAPTASAAGANCRSIFLPFSDFLYFNFFFDFYNYQFVHFFLQFQLKCCTSQAQFNSKFER